MHKRDWLEVGLLLFGLVLCINGATALIEAVLYRGAQLFGDLTSMDGWAARLTGSGVLSLVAGLLLLRAAASLARRFTPEPAAAADGPSGAALPVGLQLLGVYLCVTTLPGLAGALIDLWQRGPFAPPLPERPVDAMFAIASQWSSVIGLGLQFAAGIWIALRAPGIAGRLQRPRGATAALPSAQPTTRA
jgi:hypothetical protein